MLFIVNRWFEQVAASRDYRGSDYLLLVIILSVGTFLRFWGLGNVGLHGDEETMAMPAMSILESGQPLLPSGMFYPRALLNIYLMSGSVWMFGESEWALRLPSAITGSLTGLVAFFLGRRFLPPQFNLAFVATIAFLPAMIVISQTARMYVFFFTCMLWFGACLFRWERDQKSVTLVFTVLIWLLCLHFHALAIFAAPLFLFPGLSRQSWKQLTQGIMAFGIGVVLFYAYRHWISAKYPQDVERPSQFDGEAASTSLDILIANHQSLLVISIIAVLILVGVLASRLMKLDLRGHLLPLVIVGCGLLAMALLQYHVAAILLMFGIVFWLRAPRLPLYGAILAVVLAAVLTAIHAGVLAETGEYPGRKLIGALVGTPSVWPTLRFLEYSPIAGLVYGITFLYALSRFALGRSIPIHFLFFIMGVWAPLLILGFFAWDIPPRYAQGQLGFFLLCTFAGLAFLAKETSWVPSESRLPRSMVAAIVLVTAGIINPFALTHAVNPDYGRLPDHKGAAEHIRSLDLDSSAVLIAEDVLQQFYYLGAVDYSLRPTDDAVSFSILRDGRMIDQYTGVPVIGTGEELAKVLEQNIGNDLYIIGSGENFVGGERRLRRLGIAEVLDSEKLEVVYEGRDNKTKIWKLRN